MLTVDLVRASVRGGRLEIIPLVGRSRLRAKAFSEAYLTLAQSHVGEARGSFEEACEAILINPKERKIALGLRKLVEDRCVFEADESIDARDLRREVFERAALVRKGLEPGVRFDREVVLTEVAAARGRGEDPLGLGQELFTDLREAHILREAPTITAEALVDRYELAQAQAVLLRATHIVADVQCVQASTYRYLFGKLKFRRLLHSIRKARTGGYRVEIDGPFSLFSSVTKYGLQLALMLPVFQACDRWSLRASLLWGKERRPLTFTLAGGEGGSAGVEEELSAPSPEDLPTEVTEFITQFGKLKPGWNVEISTDILELPGLGLCVPDLCFIHDLTGEVVYFEVMGFWSRDAVWKRVELVQRGLTHKIIFAVPQRLRVSEEVLDEDLPGELYVYKTKMNAKVVAQRLDAMVA